MSLESDRVGDGGVAEVSIYYLLKIRRPPRSTRADTLFPYTTLFRSQLERRGTDLDIVADFRIEARDEIRLGHRAIASIAQGERTRSEEHTSEIQSLMRISYAVFCLRKKYFNYTLCRSFRVYNQTSSMYDECSIVRSMNITERSN